MRLKFLKFTFSFLLLSLLSCDKDPEPINEEELITTLKVVLTGSDGHAVTFNFKDIDGDGGNPPTATGGTLKPNLTYSASIQLLNESVSPTDDINLQIEDESDDHQFFYQSTGSLASNLVINYDDTDSNGRPLGLETTWETKNSSSGKLKVTLRHQPNKSASGVSMGDITNAGGETDIEVEFDVRIQ